MEWISEISNAKATRSRLISLLLFFTGKPLRGGASNGLDIGLVLVVVEFGVVEAVDVGDDLLVDPRV